MSKGNWETPKEGPENILHSLLEILKGSWEVPGECFLGRSWEAMPLVVGGVEGLFGEASIAKTIFVLSSE